MQRWDSSCRTHRSARCVSAEWCRPGTAKSRKSHEMGGPGDRKVPSAQEAHCPPDCVLQIPDPSRGDGRLDDVLKHVASTAPRAWAASLTGDPVGVSRGKTAEKGPIGALCNGGLQAVSKSLLNQTWLWEMWVNKAKNFKYFVLIYIEM